MSQSPDLLDRPMRLSRATAITSTASMDNLSLLLPLPQQVTSRHEKWSKHSCQA